MKQILVSEELLRQVIDSLEATCGHRCNAEYDPCNEQELVWQLKALLDAPAVEPVKLDTEWTPCMKLPVVVHVRHQRPGEQHVSTREGITPVEPDDLIMRGVSGEEYPIGRSIFEQTYTFDVAAPQAQPAVEPVSNDLRDRLVAISAAIAEQDDRAAQQMIRELLAAPQAQQPAVEPVAFASPEQLDNLHDPDDVSGEYLPLRKTPAGKFTQALFTTPQAQQPPRIGSGVTVEQTLEQWEHDFRNPMTPEQQVDWVKREREFAARQAQQSAPVKEPGDE